MRPANNSRRLRGRPNRKQHASPRAQVYDSHGPDCRIRGNAPQVYEKYLSLARDATSAGDRVGAESYFQFAEHYFRIMNDSTDPQRNAQQRNDGQSADGQRTDGQRAEGQRTEGQRTDGQRTDGRRGDGRRGDGQSKDGDQPFGSGDQPHVEWPDKAAADKTAAGNGEGTPAAESKAADGAPSSDEVQPQPVPVLEMEAQEAEPGPSEAEAEPAPAKPKGRPRRRSTNGSGRKISVKTAKADEAASEPAVSEDTDSSVSKADA